MDDLISRQAAIDAVNDVIADYIPNIYGRYGALPLEMASAINRLPSEQPDYDLSGYSDRLRKAAYERGKAEAQRTGRWIWDDEGYHCTECFYHAYGNTGEVLTGEFKFCPNCGARMEEQE